MLKWKMPEEKFLLEERTEEPGVPSGQWLCSLGWLSSAPCQPHTLAEAEPPLCNNPPTPRLLEKSEFPPQTLKSDRKASKPMTQQPLPIRWEPDHAPAASTK